MRVLGVQVGHDSSAALVVDGRIVADVAEERFTRIKHYCGLPLRAIEYCLRAGGVSIHDVDVVALPVAGPMNQHHHLFDEGYERTRIRVVLDPARRTPDREVPKLPLYVKRYPLPKSTTVMHVEHHLAHAASAYYTSGSSKRQLVVTMDGMGDGASACIFRGEAGKLVPLKRVPASGSLGWFYSNVTEALGWWHGDGEGKTMGLAPYGESERARGVLDRYYPKFEAGDLVEAHDFGPSGHWDEGGAVQWHFDEAYDIRALVERHGREHVAAEAQRVLEEQTAKLIYPWLERERTRNLSCAGGVFLNVKLNQRLWESGRVARHHIYPNPGDAGLAVGAALYAYFDAHPGAPIPALETIYLGPEYPAAEIEAALKLRNLSYRRVDDPAAFAAEQLAAGKIVAWFQGRMEAGPRALGNRSILMSAARAENKDIINARVKYREPFRPFCPTLLWEHRADYLEHARDELFMITSFTCRRAKRTRVPAVVHADATLRPQTVKREHNPRFWELIRRFGDLTGEPLVLNTSLNVKGEPMINHPREAIRCFYDSGLDHLVLDQFVLSKAELPARPTRRRARAKRSSSRP
jgi:carbamoyltransferase